MTQDTNVMNGTNYPKETMLAIADDRATAERAAQALRDAGFSDDDIFVLHGHQAWERIQQKKSERNIFERIFDNIQELDADEGRNSPQDYLTALKEGRSNVLVRATNDASRHRAFEALKGSGAHNITYQWRAVIEDLPEDNVDRPNPDR
jgi:vancomycin resistance protein YoaR